MDPLTYLRKALDLLDDKLYRRHYLLISASDVEIGWLSQGDEDPFIDCETASDLPALAAKIPALLKKYGIDYPVLQGKETRLNRPKITGQPPF